MMIMKVAETRAALSDALKGVPQREIGFIPTMGALHEGHMSLVRAARRAGGTTVVSIFVNPTQFNDPADLRSYPRTPERDLAMLEAEGVDVVFMPGVEEIYPEPDTRVFDFGEIDKVMEGATRPGHFNGVAQVVSRLFELVRPGRAYFGQKDFQQVAIVGEMVRRARENGEPWAEVEIVECPTSRESDGLARSSRNVLLSPEHRAAAPDIHRALALGAEKANELTRDKLRKLVTGETERSGLLKVIYFDFMGSQACIAVQAGGVRLIDNMRYDDRSTEI
jgi:pantoate--beta-alanine ligase